MTPSQQERIFDPAYASELIRIAVGDCKSALALSKAPDVRIENAFYLCHQAIEKSLKAVLVHLKLPVPLVHDLGSLFSRLPANQQPPHGYDLLELNQYASIRLYEEGHCTPTSEELGTVLQKTREMMDWASNVVSTIQHCNYFYTSTSHSAQETKASSSHPTALINFDPNRF